MRSPWLAFPIAREWRPENLLRVLRNMVCRSSSHWPPSAASDDPTEHFTGRFRMRGRRLDCTLDSRSRPNVDGRGPEFSRIATRTSGDWAVGFSDSTGRR
jgi:hypothetical protein